MPVFKVVAQDEIAEALSTSRRGGVTRIELAPFKEQITQLRKAGPEQVVRVDFEKTDKISTIKRGFRTALEELSLDGEYRLSFRSAYPEGITRKTDDGKRNQPAFMLIGLVTLIDDPLELLPPEQRSAARKAARKEVRRQRKLDATTTTAPATTTASSRRPRLVAPVDALISDEDDETDADTDEEDDDTTDGDGDDDDAEEVITVPAPTPAPRRSDGRASGRGRGTKVTGSSMQEITETIAAELASL